MTISEFLNGLLASLGTQFGRGLRRIRRGYDTLVDQLPLRAGAIRSTQQSIRFGRKIRREGDQLFDDNVSSDLVVSSLDRIDAFTLKFLGGVDLTEAELADIRSLKSTNLEFYDQLSEETRSRLNATVQNHIISGLRADDLKEEIENILFGVEDRRGNPMINQLNLLLHDGIMEYHARINIISASEAGVSNLKYVGSLIADSREFCVANAGKTFSLEEIKTLWKGRRWRGKKSDNVLIHRGGFNCRHHWQPVVRR